ncbi:histidine phosphatase family protein, partial [Rhizobiaceae bacterium]|nr:histidine phosphatase family protein [Rhizobiaceae bacterium]
LLRHGETAWNREGRFQGGTDTELSSRGAKQAADLAALVRQLADEGSIDGQRLSFTASPLARALSTAEILARALAPDAKPAIRTDPRLRELSFGRWEGMTSMEVKAAFYDERRARQADPYGFAAVDGDSMASRAGEVLAALCDCVPNTIVVTHSGIMRVALHELGGMDPTAAARTAIPHRGGLLLSAAGIALCGEGWNADVRHTLNVA